MITDAEGKDSCPGTAGTGNFRHDGRAGLMRSPLSAMKRIFGGCQQIATGLAWEMSNATYLPSAGCRKWALKTIFRNVDQEAKVRMSNTAIINPQLSKFVQRDFDMLHTLRTALKSRVNLRTCKCSSNAKSSKQFERVASNRHSGEKAAVCAKLWQSTFVLYLCYSAFALGEILFLDQKIGQARFGTHLARDPAVWGALEKKVAVFQAAG